MEVCRYFTTHRQLSLALNGNFNTPYDNNNNNNDNVNNDDTCGTWLPARLSLACCSLAVTSLSQCFSVECCRLEGRHVEMKQVGLAGLFADNS